MIYSDMQYRPVEPVETPATGSAPTNTLDPSQSTLSPSFAPYVNRMLELGAGAAEQQYQPYTGERFAGPSTLQQQAFSGIAGLGTAPSQFGTATQMATQAGNAMGSMGYAPSYFGNQYQAPGAYQASGMPSYGQVGAQGITSGYQAPGAYQAGQFGNQFQAPGAYQAQTATSGYQAPAAYQTGAFNPNFSFQGGQATQFQNQFQAPGAYQAADMTQGIGGQSYQGGQFNTQLGPVKSIQDYMSQYTTGVSDIAAREATRQADISRQAEQARLAQAGGYGGSRQAIMEAERQRNLGTQIGDIRSQGLQAAFDRAQQQRLAEAGMGMDAQKATEASRQFGASFGQQGLEQLLRARQATEGSRQFGAQQGMQAAQLQAQFGLSAQQAQEAARQFGEGQRLTAAQLQSQFGMDAQKAQEMSRQFASQQAMTGAETGARLGLQAQQQTAQERQFGAQQGMTAQQLQAQFGLSAQQAQEASRQFGSQQGMTAAQLQAQFGMDAQKANQLASMQAQQANQSAALQAAQQAEQSRQYGYGQQMTGAQLGAQYGLAGQQATEASRQFGANYGLRGLEGQLQAAQTLGSLGSQQQQTGIAGLDAMLRAGATQQGFDQQQKDFGYQQFQESMKYPYQQATYMQSLLQGMPVEANRYVPPTEGDSGISSALTGGITGLALYEALYGKR